MVSQHYVLPQSHPILRPASGGLKDPLEFHLRKVLIPQFIFLILVICLLLAACSSPTASTLTHEEQLGSRLFIQHCAACHSTAGDTIVVGPPLAGIASRAETRVAGMAARAYIEESIVDPSAFINEGYADLMPKVFGDVLTIEEKDALVAFLMTLK